MADYVHGVHGEEEESFPSQKNNKPFPEKFVTEWKRCRLREIPQYINDCVWRVPDFVERVGLTPHDLRHIDLCDLYRESDDELDEYMGDAKDLRQAYNRIKLGEK